MKIFIMTEQHIKLLRASYVDWRGDEFGAACIDPKRPYGNSSVHKDIAEILGIEPTGDEWPDNFTEEQYREMDEWHKETETALQIVLATGQFTPGVYENSGYGRDWKYVENQK